MQGSDLKARVAAFWQASNTLNQWLQGAFALSLLRASLEAGILEAALEWHSAAEIASSTGLDIEIVEDVCQALLQLDILGSENGRFRLSPSFLVLMAPDAPQTLANWLGINGVYIRTLADCHKEREPYQALAADDIATVARGAWGLPSSAQALVSFAEVDASIPEVRSVWQRGGRHMELGCGVGRDLLRIAVSYPKVTVTGVDLNHELLEEVSAQARSLGLADRVQVRCCDARRIEDVGTYDTIVWSQLFFPPEARAETIRAAFRALRSGGYALLPLLKDSPVSRLIYRRWGLPYFRPEEIRAELEQAGFEFVRLVAHPRMDYMVVQSSARA